MFDGVSITNDTASELTPFNGLNESLVSSFQEHDNVNNYIPEPDFAPLAAAVASEEFDTLLRTKTLKSTSALLNDYLKRTFEAFLSKFHEIDGDILPIELRTQRSQKLFDLFENLRTDCLELVMDFLDDRLVQDRESYLQMKSKILKTLHDARDMFSIYRRNLDIAVDERKLEFERVLKMKYDAEMQRQLSINIDELILLRFQSSCFQTLQEDKLEEIASLEAEIQNHLKSIETLKAEHIVDLQKLKVYHQEQRDILKSEMLLNANKGFDDISTDDEREEEVEEFVSKTIEPCIQCEDMRNQISELQISIRLLESSLAEKSKKNVREHHTNKNKHIESSDHHIDDGSLVSGAQSTQNSVVTISGQKLKKVSSGHNNTNLSKSTTKHSRSKDSQQSSRTTRGISQSSHRSLARLGSAGGGNSGRISKGGSRMNSFQSDRSEMSRDSDEYSVGSEAITEGGFEIESLSTANIAKLTSKQRSNSNKQ